MIGTEGFIWKEGLLGSLFFLLSLFAWRALAARCRGCLLRFFFSRPSSLQWKNKTESQETSRETRINPCALTRASTVLWRWEILIRSKHHTVFANPILGVFLLYGFSVLAVSLRHWSDHGSTNMESGYLGQIPDLILNTKQDSIEEKSALCLSFSSGKRD